MPVARGVRFDISTDTRQRIAGIRETIAGAVEVADNIVTMDAAHVGGVSGGSVEKEAELIANAIEHATDLLAIPLHDYDRFLMEAGGRTRDEVSSYWRTAQRALEGAQDNLDAQEWRLVRASLRGAQRAIRGVCRIGRVRHDV